MNSPPGPTTVIQALRATARLAASAMKGDEISLQLIFEIEKCNHFFGSVIIFLKKLNHIA